MPPPMPAPILTPATARGERPLSGLSSMGGAAVVGMGFWAVMVVGIVVMVVLVTMLVMVLVRVANVVDVAVGSATEGLTLVAVGKVVSGSEE